VPGATGTALRFDGSNDRVLIADAPDLRFGGSFTLEAWMQLGKLGTAKCIVSKGDSGKRNYWLALDSAGLLQLRWQSAGPKDHTVTSPVPIADLAWHHVAGVLDLEAGECRLYIDGFLTHRAPTAALPLTGTAPVYVGARLLAGSPKDFFNGSIDLVRLAPAVLYTGDFAPPTAFGSSEVQPVVRLAWEPPASSTVAGYDVHRQVDGGPFEKRNAAPLAGTSWMDLAPPLGELCYTVTAVDAAGQSSPPSEPACVSHAPAAAKAALAPELEALPRSFHLGAAPNPFNPSTTFHFDLPVAARVQLAVYDVRGERVATLVDEMRPAGAHRVAWLGRDGHGRPAAAGVYFALLKAGQIQRRVKLVLLK
jgi:hypothetical protein